MAETKAPDKTPLILGIRLDVPLREKIEELATAEGRTASGFARFHLARVVEKEEAKAATEMPTDFP